MKNIKIITVFILFLFLSAKTYSQTYDEDKIKKEISEQQAVANLNGENLNAKNSYTPLATLGNDNVLNSLKIEIVGDNFQVYRNTASNTWQFQWYEYSSSIYPARSMSIYVDGTRYTARSSGYTDFYLNGVLQSGVPYSYYYFVSSPPPSSSTEYDRIDIDQIDQYNATIKMTKTGLFEVLMTIEYPKYSDYIIYSWQITNLSGSTLNDIRFFSGGDTYSYGSDYGIGYWDNASNTVGCIKDDGGATVSVFLQAVQTPYDYESSFYSDCKLAVQNSNLTSTVTTTDHDNAIALEWRKSNLTDGETWTLDAFEKYSDKEITDLIVTAPLNETIAPNQTKNITFNVRNNSLSTVNNISLSEIIDLSGSGWTVNVTNPVGTFNLSAGANQDVTVEVSCPITATAGTVAQATLEATDGANTANDKAYIEVVGALPSLSAQPNDQDICTNTDAVSFSVSSSNATGHQWQENSGSWANLSDGGVYSGVLTNTLSISNSSGLAGNQYRCIVSNSIGDITSNPAEILADATDPVPDVATLSNATGQCSVTLTAPTATDDCSGALTATTSDPTTYNSQGTYTVTWTYTDAFGNTATQNQQVIINDVTAPTPDAATLSNITEECEVTSLTAPTATDNCSGTVTVTNNATLPITSNTTIIWTYEDEAGNTSTQNQEVIISDVTAPVADASSLPTLTGDCSVSVTEAPSATDNCVGEVTGTTEDPTVYNEQGSYIITWNFDDGNGNISTQTQNVTVIDDVAPVGDVSVLETITSSCNAEVTETPTATDQCAGSITGTTISPLTYDQEGTYSINWTFEDNYGNILTQTQEVIVEDLAPVVETQNITVVLYESGNATITYEQIDNGSYDDCGIETIELDITEFTTSDEGENIVVLTVTDIAGNISTKEATVTVELLPATPEDLQIPNFISPDGNGKNDRWEIVGIEHLEGFNLSIFNKIGEIIYESENYDNTWNGMYNDKELPEGTYYYIFTNGTEKYNGFITIIR